MIQHSYKNQTTALIQNRTRTKIFAAIGVIAVLLSLVVVFTRPAKADQFDAQITALNAQIAQNQAAANQKAAEANTLANKVAQLNSQIAAATADLNKTNVQITQTNTQIEAANKDLDHQKAVLKENLRTIYKQGEVSPIEVVASSKDLSDFVAQQQYLSAIKKKIDDNLKKIDTLKKELDVKKSDLVSLQSQQQAKADNVAAQKAQQADLLAQTQGDEAKYKGIAAAQSAQVAGLRAQQAAAFARIYSGGGGSINSSSYSGYSQCGGGYPGSLCNAPQDALVDQWGLYNRECVSYAAWAMQYRFGHQVPKFNGHGNANEWPSYLGAKGYRVDHSPEVGSVAIANIGGYGHAMVVEQVLSGNQVRVSQYNWWPSSNGPGGLYSTMNVSTSGLTFIHF